MTASRVPPTQIRSTAAMATIFSLAAPARTSLDGGNGNDTLTSDAGSDTLSGGDGDDALDGGAGKDTAVFTSLADETGQTVDLGAGTASGANGSDTLTGIENLTGGAGIDNLTRGWQT